MISGGNPDVVFGKRKLTADEEFYPKKPKYDGSFYVEELAHVVALCDERLPFALLTTEVEHFNSVAT